MRRFYSNKYFIPPMMRIRNFSIPGERLVQHLDALHTAHVEPSPSRQPSATLPANLPREQPLNPFLNAVVVRLDDSFFVLIPESNQPLVLNRPVQQFMQPIIDCHFTRLNISSAAA
jgi:hypothetical protein